MPRITLHLIRHAQGYHNLPPSSTSPTPFQIPDPSLTPLGISQCVELSHSFPYTSRITHLISSPLRRTLYTTLYSFPTLVAEGMKVVALPELQETSDHPCDTGSRREELEREFGKEYKGVVGLGAVEEGWNSKRGEWSSRRGDVERRAREARVLIRDLALKALEEGNGGEEVHVVAVTHGGLLHYLTEDWAGHGDFEGTGWANTEWRSYNFVDEGRLGEKGERDGASLRETQESRRRRMGDEKPLGEAKQRNLRETAEREWVGAGFTREGTVEESAKL